MADFLSAKADDIIKQNSFSLRIRLFLTAIMNQTQKLMFKSKIQILVKRQIRAMCKMKKQSDLIGPADPISNLHHIKYAVKENETAAEQELRKQREELQAWNEVFWTKHNLSFIEKKKEFQETHLREKGSKEETLTADEISVFYKDFLDKNWNTHMRYLLEWYKRNVFVTFLHFKVNIEKIFKKDS